MNSSKPHKVYVKMLITLNGINVKMVHSFAVQPLENETHFVALRSLINKTKVTLVPKRDQ